VLPGERLCFGSADGSVYITEGREGDGRGGKGTGTEKREE
jgi:hypothetical protein